MPGNPVLLSEEASAGLAGVTVETIREYCKLGLLASEIVSGKPHFKESELRTIFYTRLGELSNRTHETLASKKPEKTSGLGAVESELKHEAETKQGVSAEQVVREPEQPTLASLLDVEEDIAKTPSQVVEPSNKFPPVSYYELLEINRGLKTQVQLLREERSWLRTRIEKLETQAERSQMLLMSESETIRSLAGRQPQARNFWSFALPWFGGKAE